MNTGIMMKGPVLDSVADPQPTRPAKKKKKGKKAKAAAAARDVVEEDDEDDDDLEKRT